MTLTKTLSKRPSSKKRYRLWFERIMAMIVLINYLLVIFNLTYIPLRDFWLQGRLQIFFKFGQYELEFPSQPIQVLPSEFSKFITQYDIFKGIEPYRSTRKYLETVAELEQEINLKGIQNSDQEIDKLLESLQKQSDEMIDTNPFQVSGKTGTLERIKNLMRLHIFHKKDSSSKEAFKTFWSRQYLLENNPREQLNFFDETIAPLIETNYYRPVGENGELVDNFAFLDFLFFIIFLPEFLLRTWLISRKYTALSWFDAMLWRWYDVFLLIPLVRWLRIIPLIIRLNQAELISLQAIQKQASQGLVAGIAEDVSEVVILRVLNRVQFAVNNGAVRKIFRSGNSAQYIDYNDTDEVVEIIKIFLEILVQKVLPTVQPDAEALLKYNIEKAIGQIPAYQGLQYLPGIESLTGEISQKIAQGTYQTLCDLLATLLVQDPKFEKLLQELSQNVRKTMGKELQAQKSIDRIECLIIDLLEEIKLNYIQNLSEEDVESLLEQSRQLRQKKPIPNIDLLPPR